MPKPLAELPPEALRRVCDPASFDFDTTADLPVLEEVVGQPRAVAALEFGASVAGHGFNLFALGLPGSGKTTLIREHLERRAAGQPVPPDLCYVNNFADSRRPLALRLPPGGAQRFRQDMLDLVAELQVEISKAFDSKPYEAQRDAIVQGLEEKRRQAFEQLEQHVTTWGYQIVKAPGGMLLVPALEGKPISEADLEKLSADQREKLIKIRGRLEKDVEEALRHIREDEKKAREALQALDRETATGAARHSLDDLRAAYAGQPTVLAYLEALQQNVVEKVDDFRRGREPESAAPNASPPGAPPAEDGLARYAVNVLVSNQGLKGSPVVVESNPTYYNLLGRIEHQSAWGAVTTHFGLIKPGALHRANGGYLIIPAREVMLNPFAWEGLKRALKDQAVRIEELGTQLGLYSTVTLEPEAVPLNVKVVLIGSPLLYYLLFEYDEDFQKLFKVKADFTTEMKRTRSAERAYGLFVSTIVRKIGGPPFDRGAVARVVEYGARLAGDQDRLSTRFGEIDNLIQEAAHRAGRNSHPAVTAADVRTAEAARRFRQNLLEERLQDNIAEGAVLIATQGTAVGQVNGLSVLTVGDHAFGSPARISATVSPGQRGVLSIEREVNLSGPIHGKGVLILSGYLARAHGQSGPLSLSASLVFEQSYGLVEGDSASLAELCALLSALSGLALRQDVAVTGSVNQHGTVQAVGGVTEKIEGFFDVCQARGLTGSQGVLIPASNRRHLMLRDDVVEAVRAARFHIWLAETVDDGLALLTGRRPGRADARGRYPAGSVQHAAASCLARFARALHTGPRRPRKIAPRPAVRRSRR